MCDKSCFQKQFFTPIATGTFKMSNFQARSDVALRQREN